MTRTVSRRRAHGPYRDDAVGSAELQRRLASRFAREVDALPPAIIGVYARRRGRIAFGITGTAGALAMFGAALSATLSSGGLWSPHPATGALLTTLLVGTWLAAVVAYGVATTLAALGIRGRLARIAGPTGDAAADLERLRNLSPARACASLADRIERAAFGWPLTALSLLLPLTMHLIAYWSLSGSPSFEGFDEWVRLSVVIVGHCHALLVYRAWRFAARLRAADDRGWHTPEAARRFGHGTWMSAIGLSLIPGAMFIMIPAVLVAATGVFIPVMFGAAAHLWARERAALCATIAA